MKEKSIFLKRADLWLRLFCHRLTERQRMCLLLAMFLPFLVGCICTIGASLHDFGRNGGSGPDTGHILPLDLIKEETNEHSPQFYENGHPENQETVKDSLYRE